MEIMSAWMKMDQVAGVKKKTLQLKERHLSKAQYFWRNKYAARKEKMKECWSVSEQESHLSSLKDYLKLRITFGAFLFLSKKNTFL